MLSTPRQIFFEQTGLVFKGWLYVFTGEKYFIIPENIQNEYSDAVDSFDLPWSTAFAGFPPLGKKAAARLLEAYDLQLSEEF